MKTLNLVGAQWGDEGKGKIADKLAEGLDYVVRFQGGHNAGHTIYLDGKKIVLHLVPSGILNPRCLSVISHGVAVSPEAFSQELDELHLSGVHVSPQNLRVSANCSVITRFHRLMDEAREQQSGEKIGTTGKGIGPCYEDKIARKGLRLSDLSSKGQLAKRLELNLREKLVLLEKLYRIPFPSIEEEVGHLFHYGERLQEFMGDTFSLLETAERKGQTILFEGAQGILLDIDYGSYPYVTSSSTSYSGVYSGAFVPKSGIDHVLGVAKAYLTRVGEGPFPSELFNQTGADLQRIGGEFGATTGRIRRCGVLDLPLLKFAKKVSRMDSLALTKIDVLSQVDELKVCHAYRYEGKTIDSAFPGIDLTKVTPEYISLAPLPKMIAQAENFVELLELKEMRDFIELIEKALNIPVGLLAYGPNREALHFRQKYFSK